MKFRLEWFQLILNFLSFLALITNDHEQLGQGDKEN